VKAVSGVIYECAPTQFSLMISERAATLFFLIVSELIGAVCAEDSMRHL
jgi:hypothetical protein